MFTVLKKGDLACKDRIIIGGNFNCPMIMNPTLDKQGGILMTGKKIVERIEANM